MIWSKALSHGKDNEWGWVVAHQKGSHTAAGPCLRWAPCKPHLRMLSGGPQSTGLQKHLHLFLPLFGAKHRIQEKPDVHARLASVPAPQPTARGPGAGAAVLLMLWRRRPLEGRGDWGRARSATTSTAWWGAHGRSVYVRVLDTGKS